MRRFYDFCQRAIQRVNARIAILVVVVAAGGVAVWQGFQHLPQKQPDLGPKKQVATGVDAAGADLGVQTALAALADDQLPAKSPATRLAGYGQVGDAPAGSAAELAPPATSPYAPATGEAAGGYQSSAALSPSYGGGSYGGGSYGGASEAASGVPADPTAGQATAESVPSNPYRQSGSLGQSPYAVSDSANAGSAGNAEQAPPTVPTGGAAPTAEIANPYATPYGRDAGQLGQQPATAPAPQAMATSEPPPVQGASPYAMSSNGGGLSQPQALPQNSLPAEGLSASPYASAGAGMRSLNNSAPSSMNAGGGLSTYQSAGSHLNSLPAGEGTRRLAAATPGERQLEGPQQPAISIEKVSPAEIQVGKPATFDLYIRNAGQVPAQNVVITDHVPARTQFVDAKPQPRQGSDGSLNWQFDVMQPGEEKHISVQVMPHEEGEVGSTAHVTFAAAATSRSVCTRPQLTIEQYVSPKVLIGEPLTVAITISNPGSGPATGVVIEADVPPGLSHVAGSQIEYEVGTLMPLESKRLELTMRAEQAGLVQNTIRVVGEASLAAQHTAQIEVVAPQLQVAVEGPKVKYLERQASYTLQVANTGTAAARDVELVAQLPRGMKFVETDSQGQYDPRQHAVIWSLAELPPATSGPVKLTMLPVEPGEQKLIIKGTAGLGQSAAAEQVVNVVQSEELHHAVKDMDDVIEVGSETAYEIRVVNNGTKAATNVRVVAQMPPGIAAVEGCQGPTRHTVEPTQVIFDPLPRLNPNEEVIYKVLAQGRQAGDHIVRVQLSSDEWKTPVSREESTRVYQDR